MPIPPYATPDFDRSRSGSVTPTSSDAATSPSPRAVFSVAAAAAAIHANGSRKNHNQRNVSSNSDVYVSESDIKRLVMALPEEKHRVRVLDILSKIGNNRPERAYMLAPMLWDAPGTVYILLQEVLSAYKILDNEDALRLILRRVLNALCILQFVMLIGIGSCVSPCQCIAMHSSLRKKFVDESRVSAHIPTYLYPFLRIRKTAPSIENLRLASMGVVAALVKADDSEVIHYLLDSEVFPCCLCSMEFGIQHTKALAAFVICKLLSNKQGLHYCCNFPERFQFVLQVLRNTVDQTSQLNREAITLIKFVLGSYLALAEFPGACGYLRMYIPSLFCNGNILKQLGKVEPELYKDAKRLSDKIDAEVIQMGLPTSDPLLL